ncbi:MAG TPA: right-handed parallel beta-helix repeat-containing protein, partial [Phycisphaerae bacterium]|nr:right-handed parallel beta-helix repeat-containing protein [Phycisphaerae bacterium]
DRRAHIELVDQQDLVIDGQGSELLFHHIRHALKFIRCRRLLVRNLTIDWDFPLAAPGVVDELPDGRVVVRVSEQYPIGDKPLATAVTEYDTANYRWALNPAEVYYPRDCRLVAPQVIHSPSFAEERRYPHGGRRLLPGMPVCVRHYVYQATAIDFSGAGNEDLTFEDVTVHQCPGHAFAGYGCERGFRLSRVKIQRRPGSNHLTSATADGAHFGNCRGDILVEDCDFSHQGDDSINIHADWFMIRRRVDARTVHMTPRLFNPLFRMDVGDELTFCRGADLDPYAETRLADWRVDESARVVVLTVDRDLPEDLAEGDCIANETRSSRGFLIRNNYFHDHRARGILLQAKDGLVEGNRISRVMGCALQMTSDCNYWKEGYGCRNVVVRGNTFEGCNQATWERGPAGRHMACVNLLVDTATGLSDKPLHRDIVFEDNVIRDTPGLALLIASAKNVVVRGNRIVNANTEPFDGAGEGIDAKADGAIMITRASDVDVRDNVITGAGPAHGLGVYVDGRNTSNVRVKQ